MPEAVESRLQAELLTLKSEHEELRVQLRQVEDSLSGVDEMLATAPEEQLPGLRERLLTLYNILLRLKDETVGHDRREDRLLLSRQGKKTARELQNQHSEIMQALERSIAAMGEALPENAPREQLREASLIVQNIYYGTVGMIMKHMENEDTLIDVAVAASQMTA